MEDNLTSADPLFYTTNGSPVDLESRVSVSLPLTLDSNPTASCGAPDHKLDRQTGKSNSSSNYPPKYHCHLHRVHSYSDILHLSSWYHHPRFTPQNHSSWTMGFLRGEMKSLEKTKTQENPFNIKSNYLRRFLLPPHQATRVRSYPISRSQVSQLNVSHELNDVPEWELFASVVLSTWRKYEIYPQWTFF